MAVSIEHEAPIELCHRHPTLLPRLLGLVGQALPATVIAEAESAKFNQPVVDEWYADGALLLKDGPDVVGAVAIEVQRKADSDKRMSWPIYTAALHAKHGAKPTYLLVIATNAATARWARQPIASCQPHAPFVPLVVSREEVPAMHSLEAAMGDLPMAMLSALLHISDDSDEETTNYTLQAIQRQQSRDVLIWFCGLLRGIVDGQKLQRLEEMIKMLDPFANYVPKTEWEKEHYNRGITDGETRGEARGEAKALLRIVAARNLVLTEEQRQLVEQCRDTVVLERWIERALSARAVAEIFTERR